MTLADRIESFAAAFPNPAARPWLVQEGGQDVLYATWLMGNDYRNRTTLYGAYPPSYLERVLALFPDLHDAQLPPRDPRMWPHRSLVMHAFSGSLPPGRYLRVDVNPDRYPDLVLDVEQLHQHYPRRFVLVLADPPYSADDAKHYGTRMVNRPKCLSALAGVTAAGGFLCWLDTCWPMFSKAQWRTVGRFTVVRSTGHRVRMLSIFERVEA